MKALKPVLVIVMMVSIISTASPVYAAENIVFHMSLYIHNWRGEITSLDFYDGADASDEEAPELIIIVDDADEATTDIIVDEEQEPADEATDSEQIPSVVIEEITSEQTSDPGTMDSTAPSDSEQIPTVGIIAPESVADPKPDNISIITTEDIIEEVEEVEPEIISIISTEVEAQETEETITTEVGELQDVETYTLAREE